MQTQHRPTAVGSGGEVGGSPVDRVLEEAHDAHLRACSASSRLGIDLVLAEEVDAVGAALRDFVSTGDPTTDRARAEALLDRAERVAQEARRRQRDLRRRTTDAMTGLACVRHR